MAKTCAETMSLALFLVNPQPHGATCATYVLLSQLYAGWSLFIDEPRDDVDPIGGRGLLALGAFAATGSSLLPLGKSSQKNNIIPKTFNAATAKYVSKNGTTNAS